MKKCFNNVQIFKSSENCDKYSKSVSYETLVIGAATIGRECSEAPEIEGVITRRTSVRRGYLLEQGAQNKESLFASITWLMRLPRRIQRMLLVMTIPALAFILILFIIGESRANTAINCKTGQQSCGTNCCWSVEGETLKVTGGADGSIGKIDSYIRNSEENNYFDADGHARPWADSAGVIKNIKIEGISEIGNGAFYKMNAENVEFDNSLESIKPQAFARNNLQKLNLPDSLKTIGNQAFQLNKFTSVVIPDECAVTYRAFDDNNNTLQEVILPYNIKGSYNYMTWGGVAQMRENLKIVCMGSKEDCAKVQKSLESYKGNYNPSDTFDISSKFRLANYQQCVGNNYFWNGDSCIREPDVTKRKCCPSCKDMGGYCNRIRYTPAEAAEVLRDDDTNEIVITFRK